jgi:calpain-15
LSALTVIIERPELLDNVLITKKYNRQCIYRIRLCHNGEWKSVIIDDLFPCDESNCLLYAQAFRKQLWVILIEKAYAKLSGSYQAIISGTIFEALATLTGYTCDIVQINESMDVDFVWMKLLSSKDAGFLMGASCGKNNQDLSSNGLVSNHAYSILDLKSFEKHRLIKMRNPWGYLSWNGKWSNGSTDWTPELCRAFNVPSHMNSEDEGIFWMEFFDFLKYFNQISICKIRPDWTDYRFSNIFATHNSNYVNVYRLIVHEKCNIELSLFLQNSTNRRESRDGDLMLLVYRVDQLKYHLVMRTNHCVKKFISKEHYFKQGEYLIVPLSFNFWHSNCNLSSCSYNLVLYASRKISTEPKNISANLLADLLIELCLHKGERISTNLHNANIYSLTNKFSGLIIVAENHTNSTLITEIDASSSINVGSTRGSLKLRDTIRPRQRQVLLILTCLSRANYSCVYNIKNELKYFQTELHQPQINEEIHAPRPIL